MTAIMQQPNGHVCALKGPCRSNTLRLCVVITLLYLLIGPLFGPVPHFLSAQFDINTSVLMLLAGFIAGFCLIIFAANRLDASHGTIGNWIHELGLGKPAPRAAILAGAIIGIAWGALLLTSAHQIKPAANLWEVNTFRVFVAMTAACATILEDIVTRGYLMNRLNQLGVPSWMQLLFSSGVFALYHTLWAFNIAAFIASMVFGLVLAGLFLWGNRSLTPVILAHALAVLISEPFATKLIFWTAAL